MNNHPFHHSFAVEEGFARASREIEQMQLIQMVKEQNAGLWSLLVVWVRRRLGSLARDSSDARSRWTEPTEPQEQCF